MVLLLCSVVERFVGYRYPYQGTRRGRSLYAPHYNNKKAEITDSALATVNLSCFFFLFNHKISTPLYVGHHCLNQTGIEITSNTHVNLLYLAHMLNRTIHEVKQSIGKPIINNLPELEIPDFMDSISLLHENSQPIYNLEKIIELQKNDYMDTLYWRVTANSSYLNGLSVFKIMGYIVVTIVIIVVIGLFVLCNTMKRIRSVIGNWKDDSGG